ncbi:putative RNA ligase, T4 RnlA family [Paratrimastix pyriformis]|uniref:RNA ligase, T4 RnlA family n=1 Tax=Paratrimastix pyriformis TaxID=342808 RepID=A0ABQ8USG6_9EUKA|nr:putative RNA ligase, T4 RnlA family [Paratrimastix pyriformis]
MLALQRLAEGKSFAEYKTMLMSAPYFLTIRESSTLPIFLAMYTMGMSDMSLEAVGEARGIILEKETYRPVCVPFFKFFNYGEKYSSADQIDWENATAQEKIDGSLMKMFHYQGEWRVATNGMCDAREANAWKNITYYDAFLECASMSVEGGLEGLVAQLDPEYTYMFELVHPARPVVIKYEEPRLVLLGQRHNGTLAEVVPHLRGISVPQLTRVTSLQECIDRAQAMGTNEEGYVVCDTHFRRIKAPSPCPGAPQVKNPKYIEMAHMTNRQGHPPEETAICIMAKGEQDEYLATFPFYKQHFDRVDARLGRTARILLEGWASINGALLAEAAPASAGAAGPVMVDARLYRKNFVVRARQWCEQTIRPLAPSLGADFFNMQTLLLTAATAPPRAPEPEAAEPEAAEAVPVPASAAAASAPAKKPRRVKQQIEVVTQVEAARLAPTAFCELQVRRLLMDRFEPVHLLDKLLPLPDPQPDDALSPPTTAAEPPVDE